MYSVREVISARHVSIYCVCLSVQWLVIRRHSAVNQISVPILRVSPRDRSYWRKESSHRCDIHRKSPRVRSYWKRESGNTVVTFAKLRESENTIMSTKELPQRRRVRLSIATSICLTGFALHSSRWKCCRFL